MNGNYEKLEQMIRAQQAGHENTDIYMIGEQLLDIARRESASCELLLKDLEVSTMTLELAAAALKKRADEKKAKMKSRPSCVCVTPMEAEGVLRKFYGLADPTGEAAADKPAVAVDDGYIDLSDFL